MNERFSIQKIAVLGMMAALVFAGNFARITMPVAIAGRTSFTLANVICCLSGLLLGPIGGLASGLGSALYDLTNPLYAAECWITFLTKGAYGLAAGLMVWKAKGKWGYGRAAVATVAGALTYVVLYLAKSYFYNGLLLKGLTPAAALTTIVAKLPATTFNAVVAIVFAPILAVAIRKALERNHLTIE